jgi:hypothetical protein
MSHCYVRNQRGSMPLSNEEKSAFEIVLHNFELERQAIQQQLSALQSRLKVVNGGILAVSNRLNPDSPSSNQIQFLRPPGDKYATVSHRWAILDLLNDSPAMTTAEIAETLSAAGSRTKSKDFVSTVSAVLSSNMKEEVRQLSDGKWELTATGREAIEYIRTTPKFRGAMSWRG